MSLYIPQRRALAPKAKSKYRAVRCEVDGHTFASKAEARYYGVLQLRAKAGEVRNLVLQPVYRLFVRPFALVGKPEGELVEIGKWIGDFQFEEFQDGRWRKVVVDVKGFSTPLYRLKRKIVEALYGFTIVEGR